MTSERDRLWSTVDAVFRREADGQGLILLRLLARGEPVTVGAIAAEHGRPVATVQQVLNASPDIEYDDQGRIVGAGLTLRPTPHRFEIGGRTLYTWCAMDTLVYPRLLGESARVVSLCHATAAPVHGTIDGAGVSNLDPPTAVVSLVAPDDLVSVRSAFCKQVHFFASNEAARPWLDQHPDASLLPVTEAYDLGRTVLASCDGPSGVCR